VYDIDVYRMIPLSLGGWSRLEHCRRGTDNNKESTGKLQVAGQ